MRRRINALARGRYIPRGYRGRGRTRALTVARPTMNYQRQQRGMRMMRYLQRRQSRRQPYLRGYNRMPSDIQRLIRSFQ